MPSVLSEARPKVPRRGGQAAMLGFRFQDLWAVDAALDLIDGDASGLEVEPSGDEDTGIDFIVTRSPSVREYHSVKRRHRAGHWTLSRLAERGPTRRSVLRDLVAKTQARGSGVLCSGTSASDLEWLIEHARGSNSWQEFELRIRSNARVSGDFYKHVVPACGTKEAAHAALRCLRVRVKNESELTRDVELRIRAMFWNTTWDPIDAQAVRLLIADFAARHLGRHVTAESICRDLEMHGIVPSQLAGNTSVARRIRELNRAHLAGVQRLRINGADIIRHEAEVAVRALLELDRHVMLKGAAGSGKSFAAAQMLTQLARHGIPCFAVRLDRLHDGDLSAQAVGRRLGLPDSPVITLGEYAGGRPCVLCFDQLDALSAVSARRQSVRGPFSELMLEVERYPNMRLLLACRTFDLERDPSLRRLVTQEEGFEQVTIGPLDDATIHAAIQASGTTAAPLSPKQIQILSTPLHLFLFLETARNETVDFTTAGDLFDSFWEYKAQAVDRQTGQASSWTPAIDTLCGALSDRESLTAPKVVMDEHAAVLDALASEAVVQIYDNDVQFFHESFFDYAFARTFLRSNRDLVSWLVADAQHLFRRSQVRQVLTFLRSRETDRRRYLRTLEDLLRDDQIRFHIKKLVLDWLREFPDPTAAEWRILEGLSPELGDHVWDVLRDSVPWFDLLQDQGSWVPWLRADEDQIIRAVWLLGMPDVLDARSATVATLVAPFRDHSEPWRDRLRWLAHRRRGYASPEFQSLVIRLITDGTLDDARPGFTRSDDCWAIWHSVVAEEPAFVARVLGAWFDRQLARASEVGRDDPFQGEPPLIPSSQFSARVITECAERAPRDFTRQLLRRLARLDRRVPVNWVFAPSRFGRPDRLLWQALADAMVSLASNDPDELDAIVGRADISDSIGMSAVLLQAWTANPMVYADRIVRFLLERPDQRLSIGYAIVDSATDALAAISRSAVAAASAHCSEQSLGRLIEAILHFRSDWERNTQHAGRTELALLRALPETRVHDVAQRRLRELERRLPHAPERGAPDPPSEPFVISQVGPPVPEDVQGRMSDDEWIAAMARYAIGWEAEPDATNVGGAIELSRGLQVLVRKHSERFARLAGRMDASLHPAYFEAILQGLARTDDGGRGPGTLGQVCVVLRRIASTGVHVDRAEVARAIAALADEQIPDEILTMLCEIAQNPADPRADEWQDRGPGFGPIDQALNSVRGAAAFAISKLLFADRSRWAVLRFTVERLARDPVLAVRTATAPCLLAVLDSDREDAMGFFRMLVDDADAILDDRHVGQFVQFAMFRDYIAIRPVLRRMLLSPQSTVAVAGAKLIAVAALSIAEANEDLDDLLRTGAKARVGVAKVCAEYLFDETVGAECERRLRTFFADDDPAVRTAASSCWNHLKPDQIATRGHLIRTFAQTMQADDDASILVHKLQKTNRPLPSEVCDLAERSIETFGPRAASWQFLEGGVAEDLSHLMVRLYQETTDDELRTRVLVDIDKMVRAEFVGMDERLRDQFDR